MNDLEQEEIASMEDVQKDYGDLTEFPSAWFDRLLEINYPKKMYSN